MRKVLSMILALAMVLSLAVPAFAADGESKNPFVDVPDGKYYTEPVLWALEQKITTGKTQTTFEPEEACTRKQIVTFLWRYAGEPEPDNMDNPFTDVVRGDRFEKAILWAYYTGITTGTSATEFSPESTCTRKQIVTFLWRYSGEPETDTSNNPFVDVTRGDRFEKAILWAYNNGITTGRTETTFEPEQSCTRGQIVTFLYRAHDREPLMITDMEVSTEAILPAGKTEYYTGYIFDMYLTISDAAGLSVELNGQTYTADESGVLEVYFPAAEGMGRPMPVEFNVVNGNDTDTAFAMSFTYPVGTMMNPEMLFALAEINVSLDEGNSQGYYYSYYSRSEGTLVLSAADYDASKYDVILTSTGSYAMNMMSESEDGTVSIDVKSGDTVTIQVVAMPDGSWNYPALELTLVGEFVFPVGSQSNPEALFGLAEVNVSLAEGNSQGHYYSYYSRSEGTLVLSAADYDASKYDVILTSTGSYAMNMMSESEDGTVSIDVKSGDTVTIQVVTMPDGSWNYPALEVALMGEFAFPTGSQMNPEVLSEISEVKASVPAGNTQGYYYCWTADADGELTITAADYDASKYDVVLTSSSSYAVRLMSEGSDGVVVMDVKTGDVVTIQVVAIPDGSWNYPAVELTFSGSIA